MEKIAFCLRDYETPDGMWKDISTTMQILTRNRYECAFRFEDCDVYILEFDYDRSNEFGNETIHWIDEEDYMKLQCLKEQEADGDTENELPF